MRWNESIVEQSFCTSGLRSAELAWLGPVPLRRLQVDRAYPHLPSGKRTNVTEFHLAFNSIPQLRDKSYDLIFTAGKTDSTLHNVVGSVSPNMASPISVEYIIYVYFEITTLKFASVLTE